MNEFLLTNATLTLWRVRLCAVGGAVLAAVAALSSVSPCFFVLGATIFVLLSFFILFYLPKYFRSYSVLLDNEFLHIKRGVIIETESILPLSAVISVCLWQTPLCRCLKLCETTVFAAKTRIFIAALPENAAEEIKRAASQ